MSQRRRWKRLPGRLTALLMGLAVVGAAVAVKPSPPTLPPLTDGREEHLPGKFVWADLFTSDVAAARRFYSMAFGWEWRPISDSPQEYGVFFHDGRPVAGVAFREPPGDVSPYGRWVHYVSVEDVAAVQAAVVERGGRVLLEARSFPDRGTFSIVSTANGAIFGLMRSDRGDPPDYRAEMGEWIWRQLFAKELDPAAEYYHSLIGYEVFDVPETPSLQDRVLVAGGYMRAGVGQMPEDAAEQAAWLGYVRVEDVNAALAQARAMGAEVILAPDPDVADGGLAIIADPTGATLGLLRYEFPAGEDGP